MRFKFFKCPTCAKLHVTNPSRTGFTFTCPPCGTIIYNDGNGVANRPNG